MFVPIRQSVFIDVSLSEKFADRDISEVGFSLSDRNKDIVDGGEGIIEDEKISIKLYGIEEPGEYDLAIQYFSDDTITRKYTIKAVEFTNNVDDETLLNFFNDLKEDLSFNGVIKGVEGKTIISDGIDNLAFIGGNVEVYLGEEIAKYDIEKRIGKSLL